MSDLRKASEQALEVLRLVGSMRPADADDDYCERSFLMLQAARNALRAALAAPQGEPVAWMANYVSKLGEPHVYVTSHHDLAVENDMHGDPAPLYAAPPARTPLSDEQIEELQDIYDVASVDFVRAVEAAHGIGGKP